MIFGSTAIKHWFPDFREPKDLDVMSESGKMEQKEQHYWVPTFGAIIAANNDPLFLDPENLLAIKESHLGFDIHWSKTLGDILFLKEKGVKSNGEFYKSLVKDFTKIHGKKWASLKDKDSDSFFKDAVKRKHNHDELHELVAVYGRPLYEKILKNPETKSVECSKEKFDNLSFDDRLLCVREEIWVTALERFLIPSDFSFGNNLAYFKSFKKLATTMSSGWFKEFIIKNVEFLYKNEDWSFINKYKSAYES